MFLFRNPSQPFMATPCREMGLDKLERLTECVFQRIETLKPLNNEDRLSQLLSLKATFHEGFAIVNTLINETPPINKLPPEILGHIFALVPGRQRSEVGVYSHCSFTVTSIEDLHALPKVCRYWRELALATPNLWSTISTTNQLCGSYCEGHHFRHSIYLRDNPSLKLSVCVQTCSPSPRMEETLLRNAPRIRELHYSDVVSGPELPDFLQSFDANVLEKCFFFGPPSDVVAYAPRTGAFSPFFSGGGTRLRSLCLAKFSMLPENEFPALSSLTLCLDYDISTPWDLWDLLKFLSGCPMLEDIHVCSAWFTTATPTHDPHAINTPVPLSRLRYLYFQYDLLADMDEIVDSATQIIDFLLSHMAIPSTCHFMVDFHNSDTFEYPDIVAEVNRGYLDSIRRYVPDKNHISHVALWFPDKFGGREIGLQLVFPKGSVRLFFTAGRGMPGESLRAEDLLSFLRAYPATFASTTELRIHYGQVYSNSCPRLTLPMGALPAIFPNVKLVSTIGYRAAEPLIFPEPLPLRVLDDSESLSGAEADTIPYPALETLWVTLHDDQLNSGAAQLKEDLAARVEMGFPIRRVIVAYRLKPSQPPTPSSDDLRDRLALEGMVDEVVFMGIPPQETPEEVDWMVRYPEKYALPADVSRDWPVWRRSVDRDAALSPP